MMEIKTDYKSCPAPVEKLTLEGRNTNYVFWITNGGTVHFNSKAKYGDSRSEINQISKFNLGRVIKALQSLHDQMKED